MGDWLERDRLEDYSLKAALILASGVAWYLFGQINIRWFAFANFGPGIDLVYLPAGIRLLIVLIARKWGAIGITLANTLLFTDQFGSGSGVEIVTNSLIAGFGPLLAVWLSCKILGIGVDLTQLSAKHLPILALVVSVITPLLFNLHFLIYGIKPLQLLPQNLSAMMLGDFLGCLVVLIVARLAIGLFRQMRTSGRAEILQRPTCMCLYL